MVRRGVECGADSLRYDARRALLFLESCERGAVVVDVYGHAWQESGGYWYRAYGDDSRVTAWEACTRGPFKLLQPVK